MAHVGSRFGVHWKRAEGYATHVLATNVSQGWKGIDHCKEVIEVPERDAIDEKIIDGCECGEKSWEAGMERDVL